MVYLVSDANIINNLKNTTKAPDYFKLEAFVLEKSCLQIDEVGK